MFPCPMTTTVRLLLQGPMAKQQVEPLHVAAFFLGGGSPKLDSAAADAAIQFYSS